MSNKKSLLGILSFSFIMCCNTVHASTLTCPQQISCTGGTIDTCQFDKGSWSVDSNHIVLSSKPANYNFIIAEGAGPTDKVDEHTAYCSYSTDNTYPPSPEQTWIRIFSNKNDVIANAGQGKWPNTPDQWIKCKSNSSSDCVFTTQSK